MLLMNKWKGKADLRVITGGDALTKEQGKALTAICKEVWNCYGPTETTIYSTRETGCSCRILKVKGSSRLGNRSIITFCMYWVPGLMPASRRRCRGTVSSEATVSHPDTLTCLNLLPKNSLPIPFSDEPGPETLYRVATSSGTSLTETSHFSTGSIHR